MIFLLVSLKKPKIRVLSFLSKCPPQTEQRARGDEAVLRLCHQETQLAVTRADARIHENQTEKGLVQSDSSEGFRLSPIDVFRDCSRVWRGFW